MSDIKDAKAAEKTLVDDVLAEGALEDKEHSMEASIKPNYDIEGNYPLKDVANAIDSANRKIVNETIEVGTDDEGHQYAEVKENVAGSEN